MFESGSSLWRWLADQPPFIEVGIGMAFVLLLAPGVLAAVALLFARLEILGRYRAVDSELSGIEERTCNGSHRPNK